MQKPTYTFDFFTNEEESLFISYVPRRPHSLLDNVFSFDFVSKEWSVDTPLERKEKEYGSDWIKDLLVFIADNHDTIPKVSELLNEIYQEIDNYTECTKTGSPRKVDLTPGLEAVDKNLSDAGYDPKSFQTGDPGLDDK